MIKAHRAAVGCHCGVVGLFFEPEIQFIIG